MTSQQLAKIISKLSPEGEITKSLEFSLSIKYGSKTVWYKTQKEHWLGWLSEYESPGAYGRVKWGGRDASYIYNHIQCAPMLLWLAEAIGISRPILLKAKKTIISSGKNGASQCSALRRIITWEMIDSQILKVDNAAGNI